MCFITDAHSRMIVGWRVAGHMRTTMVLDAIEMARLPHGKALAGLRCHSIYGPARTGPWKTIEDVELATLSWAHWHNTRRLHGCLDDQPPAEFEAAFYATKRTDHPWPKSNSPSLHQMCDFPAVKDL